MRFRIGKVKAVTRVTPVTHHVNPTHMRAHAHAHVRGSQRLYVSLSVTHTAGQHETER